MLNVVKTVAKVIGGVFVGWSILNWTTDCVLYTVDDEYRDTYNKAAKRTMQKIVDRF